jgi:uncharacterized protein
MKIWVDLSNSPHALLFEPVVSALREQGHDVWLTARDNAQTAELARSRWPEVDVIGGESPRARAAKAAALAHRVAALRSWAMARRPDVAVSHNSYAQIVAAKAAGVRVATAMDYEHQPANQLAFRLADVVLLPDAMRNLAMTRQGATPAKTRYYPGLKEELYLGDFEPEPQIPDDFGWQSEILVVARTPPTRALYHGEQNPVFVEALLSLCRQPQVRVVVLARHAEQRSALAGLGLSNLAIPTTAVDSRALMHRADLVIGAGGTMTREAALLGVPTYSVFAGKPAAVDSWLEQRGMLRRMTSPEQFGTIERRSQPARTASELRRRSELLLPHFTAAATLAPPPASSTGARAASRVVVTA